MIGIGYGCKGQYCEEEVANIWEIPGFIIFGIFALCLLVPVFQYFRRKHINLSSHLSEVVRGV